MKKSSMLNRMINLTNSIGIKLFVLLAALLLLSFGFVTYVNIYFFTSLFQEDILNNAVQVSNLVKRATYHSMLENRRDDLTNMIASIGREDIFGGIRIYNKEGEITFSDKHEELGQIADKKAEQCYVCHAEEPAKGVIPTKDRARILIAPAGYRVLGLINPIENEPACYNAACHAHSPKEKLLGLLDVKLSLNNGDRRIAETRNRMISYSIFLISITVLVIWFFIRKMIDHPIKKLNEATIEVANLNLDHKVEIDSNDELGSLASSFNKMTEQLKTAKEAIENWSMVLEFRVREKSKELEKTQSQLILAEKMASMGELSAMVAHEINNPLSGILFYAKVSDKYLSPEKRDDESLQLARHNLAVIAAEATRCGDIVKNLLAFTKKTSGDFVAAHLNTIVNNSTRIIDHSINVKGLQLVKDLDQSDDSIRCDVGGIQQILVALLVNAIEATPRGAQITVKTDVSTAADRVRIIVSDEGAGIPEAVLPKIFEPFFSTKEKNTGLGLSLVYSIVEQHSGVIEVKSTVGSGTAFTITLPRVPPKKEALESTRSSASV